MSKAITMAKVSAKGGFSLFLGVSLSNIISAVGVILLLRLLTPAEYALVAIALIPPTLVNLFRDWGLDSAIVKYVAQYRSENRTSDVRKIVATGLLFEIAIGIILSVISFSLAGFLATNVFHRPDTKTLIEIASITIFLGTLLTVSQSTFTGFERMEFNSIIMICQSTLKTFLAPLLVLVGYGALGAVLGHTVAFFIAGALAIGIFYLLFYRDIHGTENDGSDFRGILKGMLRYGLPLSLSIILAGSLSQFYNFMMVIYCNDLMIGNYSAAVNFTILIAFFTTPIATVLFPAFSKLDPEKEMETLRTVFQSSVKYAALFTVPVTVMIVILSEPLVFTLFGERWSYAPLFLSLYAVNFLYSGLGSLSLGNFLNGLGETRVTMTLTFITMGIGLPLSLMLIPTFGITGLIVTTLVAGVPSLAIGLWWVKKHFGVTVNWVSSTKIFLASVIAAVVTHITLSQLSFQEWIKLVIGGVIFLAVYLIAAPLTRAVDKSDIKSLKEMLSELGPFSHLFYLPLNITEKLLTIFTF